MFKKLLFTGLIISNISCAGEIGDPESRSARVYRVVDRGGYHAIEKVRSGRGVSLLQAQRICFQSNKGVFLSVFHVTVPLSGLDRYTMKYLGVPKSLR